MVQLFEREIGKASADEDKPIAEAVADLRQRLKELDIPTDQLPDSFFEVVIRTTRRLQAMSPIEQEIEIYGRPLDEITNEETTSEEAKTA